MIKKDKKDDYDFDKVDLGIELRKLQRSLLLSDLILPGILFVLTLIGYYLI